MDQCFMSTKVNKDAGNVLQISKPISRFSVKAMNDVAIRGFLKP